MYAKKLRTKCVAPAATTGTERQTEHGGRATELDARRVPTIWRARDEGEGPVAFKALGLTPGARRLIVPRAEDDDDVCVQVGGGRAREVQCETGKVEEVGTSASDGGRGE